MKILKKIGFIVVVTIILTYLFIVISPRIFSNFYPFGIKTAIVLTGSMSPTIEIDDFVIIKKPENISINDIVSFKESDGKEEILHRVVSINGDEITTKGDANNTTDNPIDRSQITGVYVGKIEFLGKFISFVTKPLIFSIIITVLLIPMLIPSKKSKSDKRKEGSEKE